MRNTHFLIVFSSQTCNNTSDDSLWSTFGGILWLKRIIGLLLPSFQLRQASAQPNSHFYKCRLCLYRHYSHISNRSNTHDSGLGPIFIFILKGTHCILAIKVLNILLCAGCVKTQNNEIMNYVCACLTQIACLDSRKQWFN